ncbi:MAG: Ppx/GppA phosphatase family protein [Pseudomonadota bacterium]
MPDRVLAAVDLGSNSFHMLVVRQVDGGFAVLDRLREMVRLASGIDEDGCLSEDSRARALECLARFGQRLRVIRPGRIRVVGTNTFRRAKQIDQFLIEAREALGHPIEIISGREEARLIFLGAAHTLPAGNQRRLVVDIGGGSTEVISGEGLRALTLDSLYMGCVSMSQTYFPGGKITAKRFRKAQTAAQVELEALVSRLAGESWDEAVGASGTIKATEAVLRELGWRSGGITASATKRLVDLVVDLGHIDQIDLPGLSPQRAPVYVGGLAILMGLLESLELPEIRVSNGALREGVLHDLVGRYTDDDARIRTVDWLQSRFAVDVLQAARVESTTLVLLDQCAEQWRLKEPLLQFALRWAAQVHEVGMAVAHAQYHKHGAYLIENGDLPGFSRHEQELVGRLVRAHRRKIVPSLFEGLQLPWRASIPRAAILLRLAVVLHRSRNPAPLPPIQLRADGAALHLLFPPGWLEAHPLTLADLQDEAEYLLAIDVRLVVGIAPPSRATAAAPA